LYQYKTVSNTDIKQVSIRCLIALYPYELLLSKVDGVPPPEMKAYALIEKEVEVTKKPTQCLEGHEMHKYTKAIKIDKFNRDG
jgi:hypothetical protein